MAPLNRAAIWATTLAGIGAMGVIAALTRADPLPVVVALVFLGGALARAVAAFALTVMRATPAVESLARELTGGIVMGLVAVGATLAARQWVGPPPPPLVPAVAWLLFEAIRPTGRRQPL